VKCGEEFEEGVGCLACKKLALHCGYLDDLFRQSSQEKTPDGRPLKHQMEGSQVNQDSTALNLPTLDKMRLLEGNIPQAPIQPITLVINEGS